MLKIYRLIYVVLVLAVMQAEAVAAKAMVAVAEDLEKDANVVVLSEEVVFTVNSVSNGTMLVKTRIKILNQNGQHKAKLYVPYNKLEKVDFINGTSYDLFGKKIKSIKNKDIKDVSAVSGNLFDDHRAKIADLSHLSYPYIVEFEYQTISNNMLFYPVWQPLDDEKLSVKQASFQVKLPKEMKLRYKELNLKEKVSIGATPTHDVYTWKVENLTPVEREPYGPLFREMVPVVYTAPSAFEVEGYKGNMDSWASYGQWVNKLNEGRGVLPEATKQKLQALVAGITDPAEKVKKIYSYLQANTRYVSIQLGIGGWQPFEASFVDAKGYGDCKALTNYTQSMLKAVGIESYHALVLAGDDMPDIQTDFPSQQFNHVVLCVPMQQDTVWLECTSQSRSAGYAGEFTGGRHALLITPEGGKVVKTPDYSALDNAQKRTITVKLDEKGDGAANIVTLYSGIQHDTHEGVINNMSVEEQRKWLYKFISLPSFDISTFTFDLKKDRVPTVTEKVDLSMRKCVNISGKRMFLTPNLLNKWSSTPPAVENRQWEVVRTMSFLDVDTVVYQMPAGYSLEFKPDDVTHKSVFGEYNVTIKVDGDKVTYIRTLQMQKGRYGRDTYPALIEFINNIVKADNKQVVFVKNVQ
ncbi:DUF3857 domain-containing protein [Botryobacter ruber]|uniref:DUF3857 domain-containing protein n=1 Tax=Botryobacter ruber TaxID=2171629 RepID=UPI000E0B716C|nr:DUF3857 domain-containing protein [Botryobacter ruber]